MTWYHQWHESKYHPHLHWGSLIVLSLLLTNFLIGQINSAYQFSFLEVSQVQAQATEEHDYFNQICGRLDKFVCYSLRDAAKIQQYSSSKKIPLVNLTYIYPNDPDPRKQDAMRIRIPEGQAGPGEQLVFAVGPTNGANFLFVIDLWMGAEWNRDYSLLELHKNASPIYFTVEGSGSGWYGTQISYSAARQYEDNQPAGGPYVAMIYAHVNGGFVKTPNWWRDGYLGYPRAKLPYGAPTKEQRTYVEAIQPFDTSVNSSGAEFGIVAERWTRIWHFFERVPSEDYTTDGETIAVYKWSVWFADTVRDPVRMVDEALVGIPVTLTKQFVQGSMGFGAGNSSIPARYAGRGDLIGYTRNLVVLQGTSKSDVLTLLQKPVASLNIQTTPSVGISADPQSITPGSSSTLRWYSARATSCTASGDWSGSKTISGSLVVKPTINSIYTITCMDAQGTASKSITVTTDGTVPPTPTPTPPPSPTPLRGDLNLDGIVNSIDWSIMNSRWFTNDSVADLNKDGIVNSIDFSLMNANWLRRAT